MFDKTATLALRGHGMPPSSSWRSGVGSRPKDLPGSGHPEVLRPLRGLVRSPLSCRHFGALAQDLRSAKSGSPSANRFLRDARTGACVLSAATEMRTLVMPTATFDMSGRPDADHPDTTTQKTKLAPCRTAPAVAPRPFRRPARCGRANPAGTSRAPRSRPRSRPPVWRSRRSP
jgi:hypothetical protein